MNDLNNKRSNFFSIFFIVGLIFTILAFTIFIFLYSSGGLYIHIDEIDTHASENITYLEITKEELEEYPAVGKAINSYIETNEHEIKINMRDQGQVNDFFEKKYYESAYLFNITDAGLEENLNKGIITDELRIIFKSNGLTISENDYANTSIQQVSKIKWRIFERENKTYEILKEEGRLNVYDENCRYNPDQIFKFGELYCKIDLIYED